MITVKAFIHECCVVNAEARAQSSALLEAYQKWSGDKFMRPTTFASRLHQEGFENQKGTGGYMYWHGLGLALATDEPSGG